MIKIIPAILAKSFDEFERMVRAIEPFIDLVHLDIADGQFVPNLTIDGAEELKKIETKLNFEVHLMVQEPEKIIEKWLETKAVRYLIHWESARSPGELINKIKKSGPEAGLVLNPKTDYSAVEPDIDKIELIQFMTVDPGFQGSPFLPSVLEKIKNFHERYATKIIQVDGGINPETIKLVEGAGASCAAVGSYIFKSSNIKEALNKLNV